MTPRGPVSTLSTLLARHTTLPGSAVAHLQRVVGEWQLVADLSFADVLLWIPLAGGSGTEFLCVAQCRPTTTSTAHPEDMVGTRAAGDQQAQLSRALQEGTMRREDRPRWYRGRSMRREAVPVGMPGVTTAGTTVAVLGRDTNLATPRVPSTLEITYLAVAADLCQMIADGTFPTAEGADEGPSSPRVGDGLVRVSASGRVLYTSPNAASAFHRLGWADELVGADLPAVVRAVSADALDGADVVAGLRDALDGTTARRAELEGSGASAVVRALPLRPRGAASGALVLVRDVTDVRRRDRALLSKDATIREIHHRVKNNLQTVAALLRMQARRAPPGEAQAALHESMRRVASIAMVHEALAASVDEQVAIDDVLDRVLPMMNDVTRPDARVAMRRRGTVGVLPAVMATPLVMVVTELVANALEHGFAERSPGEPGEVVIDVVRTAASLQVEVRDDGVGLPAGFALEQASGLGLHIVRALVDSELSGTLEMGPAEGGGTRADLRVPLDR